MKYYSDKLYNASQKDKSVQYLFDTEKDLKEAEEKLDKQLQERKDKQAALVAARKEDAEKIKGLKKAMDDAQGAYIDAVRAFIKKYGYWHESYTTPISLSPDSVFKIFDSVFGDFFLR